MWGCIRAVVGIRLVFVSFSEVYGLVGNAAKHISTAEGVDTGAQEPELGRHQKLAANAHSLPGSNTKAAIRSNVTVSSDEGVGSVKPDSVEVLLDTHGEEPRGCDSADVSCTAQATNSGSESGDTRWQGQRHIRKLWRMTVLSCRFAPLFLTIPVAITPLGDYWWDNFLDALDNSGPFFVKFSQWVASRDDIFPLFLTQRFARFHSHVKAHPIEVTHGTLQHSFGPDWSKKLRLTEEHPVGGGCIAQAYRGKLQVDEGEDKDVAIKVMHPHVREQILQDAELAVLFTKFVAALPFGPSQRKQFPYEVEQFCTYLYNQTDLSIEVDNMEKFRTNFATDDHIAIPEVFHRWATPTAFVMSFERGVTLDELVGEENEDEQKEPDGSLSPSQPQSSPPSHILRNSLMSNAELAELTIAMFSKMLFVDNLVHGDLHPGNVLFDNTPPGRIVLLDFGLASSLSPERAQVLEGVSYYMILGDPLDLGMFLFNASGVPASEVKDLDVFCSRMENVIQNRRSGMTTFSDTIRNILQVSNEHRVPVPIYMSTIVSICMLEGIAWRLDPDAEVFASAAPYVMMARMQRMDDEAGRDDGDNGQEDGLLLDLDDDDFE